jgi:hypothetical protein
VSAIAERARDFWDRISPRERGMVVIAAIAAPITIAIWLGLAIGDGLSNMEARNDKLRKALTTVEYLKVRGPQQPADDLLAGMPVEPLSLETYLANAASTAGFVLKATTPRTPIARNGFITSSVSFNASDLTIDQLKKFLQEIETKSRYVVVTNLEISRPSYKAKEKLDAVFEVSTYAHAKQPDAAGAEAGSDTGAAEKGG